MEWSVVYKRAIEKDGTLLFPERLSAEFLASARRTMGSYMYANQYQNEVIPDDEKTFRPEWIRHYKEIPSDTYRFGFIDPAIGQKNHHDYTGVCVVDVDSDGTWYLRLANRYRITPTEIVKKMFDLCETFKLQALGVEIVAYQEALMYILAEEMNRRKVVLPVKGITRRSISKETRVLGLVPRFEWGKLLVAQGLTDFEDEYSTFPRGAHDDILDSLASIEDVVFYPEKKEVTIEKPNSATDPGYERWYISQLSKKQVHSHE